MYVENTNTGFSMNDLTSDQMELIEEGLIHVMNVLPRQPEFKKQRRDCADIFIKMDIELVNSRHRETTNS